MTYTPCAAKTKEPKEIKALSDCMGCNGYTSVAKWRSGTEEDSQIDFNGGSGPEPNQQKNLNPKSDQNMLK